jgi:hypothetical protein
MIALPAAVPLEDTVVKNPKSCPEAIGAAPSKTRFSEGTSELARCEQALR